jgi:hypothetical protein
VDAFSGGHEVGLDDAAFETISGDDITGEWLVSATDPLLVGTARGGVPIITFWSTTSMAAGQIDAWSEIGAITASGASSIQFNVNVFGRYFSLWSGGETYSNSSVFAVTWSSRYMVNDYVEQQGRAAPWNCDPFAAQGVLGQNGCAEDFFSNVLGPNPAKYDIGDVYDVSEDGAENMQGATS